MKLEVGKILDIDGVAKYTTLSKTTIYKKISANQIPFHKIGHRTLFVQDEIDNWVRNDGVMAGKLPDLNFFKN
jgi:excisionase family DNA binding protein